MKIPDNIDYYQREVSVMKEVASLREKGICDNFVIIRHYGIYDSNVYHPHTEYDGHTPFIIMDKYDNRLFKMMKDESLLVSSTFQLLYGLAAGIHHLLLDHGDIYPRNILASKCDHSRLYKVGETSYFIPSNHLHVVYADFDLATVNCDSSRDVGYVYEILREMHESDIRIGDEMEKNYVEMMEGVLKIMSRTPSTVTDLLALFSLPYFDSLRKTPDGECETFYFYL